MSRIASIITLTVVLATAGSAHALPIFARKYKTSCVTCHTIFPKLNPFGEQFRRNGYRFPGVDSDAVKAEPIEMGTDEQKKQFPSATWPALLSSFPPLAFGFNGQAVFHPDPNSGGGTADNHAAVNFDTLIQEGHLWSAGSIDDKITFYSELTASRTDGVDFETAALYFNDLIGPAHAVNVAIGRRIGDFTSFQNHGSYFNDIEMTQIPVTGFYGNPGNPFLFNDDHNGIQIDGVIGDAFDYSAGWVAGTNLDTRTSANFYGHVGYKLGGASLTGERTGGAPRDLDHEHSLTFDAFGYESISRFDDATAPLMNVLTKDTSFVAGGAIRAQWAQLELDVGGFWETDDHVTSTAPTTRTVSQWNELAYLLYPWLAVGGRVEYLSLAEDGQPTVSDLRIMPGVAALVRPNIKLVLTASLEQADGMPVQGWGAAGLSAAPPDTMTKVDLEVEYLQLFLFAAF